MPLSAFERRALTKAQNYFGQIRAAENRFAIQLRKLASHIGHLISGVQAEDPVSVAQHQRMLGQYADLITPWATASAQRMVADVAQRDARAWYRSSKDLGTALRQEVYDTPIGVRMRQLVDDQVTLIRDIPLEAGRQMQAAAMQYATGGIRYTELIPKIKEIAPMTARRATLIARTETGKAQSAITRARAEYVGSDSYVWRTARDIEVRPAHRKLEGKVFRWDDPPVAEENGDRHHPGNFPNCRCFAVPQLGEAVSLWRSD